MVAPGCSAAIWFTVSVFFASLQLLSVAYAGSLRFSGRSLRCSGGTYADLPRLTQTLRLVGDLPSSVPTGATPPSTKSHFFDDVSYLVTVNTDGEIKPELIKEMDVPLVQRVRQIELALERWRWRAFLLLATGVGQPARIKLRALDGELTPRRSPEGCLSRMYQDKTLSAYSQGRAHSVSYLTSNS